MDHNVLKVAPHKLYSQQVMISNVLVKVIIMIDVLFQVKCTFIQVLNQIIITVHSVKIIKYYNGKKIVSKMVNKYFNVFLFSIVIHQLNILDIIILMMINL